MTECSNNFHADNIEQIPQLDSENFVVASRRLKN